MQIQSAADLRAVILELGAADPDPGVVAEKITAQLTDREAHVVARATLRNYVRLVLVNQSISTTSGQSSLDEAGEPAQYATASGQKTASAATAALIDWYEAELMRPMNVGDEWKRLRDCTIDDLQHIVTSRRSKAADILAEAKRYERLRVAVKQHKAVTVADLDPAVGREVLAR